MAKKSLSPVLIAGGVIVGIALLIILLLIGSYNGLVSKDEDVAKAWGNVQASYQRRADLIPNLVDTVKGARDFEASTLTEITKLRGEAVSASAKVADATTPQALNGAGGEISSVLSRLLVIVENYPDLKSNQNFLSLQDQLEGTENRINYERTEYNDKVRAYRASARSFPTVIVAGMLGFSPEKHQPFAAQAGAENAPDVNFG